MPKHWIPLESNPEVLNEFAQKLGVTNIPSEYSFCDIFGLDDELLAMVPSPVLAVILLFPITAETEQIRKEEAEQLKANSATSTSKNSVYYMKQTIGNACGTIGLLHCVSNSKRVLNFKAGSFLDQFLKDTENLTPDARGKHLEHPPEGARSIDAIHEEAAQQGATEAPPADADVDLHFVAFVPGEGGHLWELDGRKTGPIDHGQTTSETLLRDVAAVVRTNFVEKANSLNFSLIALAAAQDDDY